MSEQQTPNQQEEPLRQILVSPRRMKSILLNENRTRPNGWSKRSTSAYYKPFFGEEMKAVFDGIANDGKTRTFLFSDANKVGQSPSTLYTRINHSIRYLIEQMDDTGKYRKQLETEIMVEKEVGVGYHICKRGASNAFGVVPRVLADIKRPSPKWKEKLDEFVTNSKNGDEFCEDRLCLDAAQIRALEEEFAGVGDKFIYSFTSAKVFVVNVGGNNG